MDSDIKRMGGLARVPQEKYSSDVEAAQCERGHSAGGSNATRGLGGNRDYALRQILGYCLVLAAFTLLARRVILEFDISKVGNSHESKDAWNIEYSAVPGFFKQSIWGANATEIGPSPKRFGLIDNRRKYWATFREKIKRMNKKSDKNTAYKVLFLGRHGEGYHNLGLNYYGEEVRHFGHVSPGDKTLISVQRKWGRLTGNGTITWGPDAKLTPNGIEQANRVNAVWKNEMQNGGGIPLPTALFISPLRRALFTLDISFNGVVDSATPLIIENIRDAYGLRTSDWRHNKTWIHERFPRLVLPPVWPQPVFKPVHSVRFRFGSVRNRNRKPTFVV
ncbi:hypothetical protein FRC00_005262 [Tulasnella sp. 408]|nr:hypothetical protein FRC00_005262 [Tulasnella sp. 408]